MADDTLRTVQIERLARGSYVARNARGGEVHVASDDTATFTPVELLLAAIGACTAVDVDTVTSRRAAPDAFEVRVDAHKVRDESGGSLLRDVVLTFRLEFPEGEAGDAARAVVPRALQVSHDRSCTVSRTLEAGTPVEVRVS